MSRGNKKAGARRLAKMSPDSDSAWYPDLPPDGGNFEQVIPISETTSYIIRCGYDIYGRLTEWALIQRCNKDGVAWRVAVYDACHGKGLHVHIYDRENQEIDQHPLLRPVSSYIDVEAALDYATERVVTDWLENERRSERGK